ncbi:hypothetical protein SAMN05444358_111111 [Ruegeria halocynthiae]|uniref:Lysylphosphatidylglycerol synthase TM region n=1 Tax=Ruegeria halocynthiae TaxID=985054 RepID=A0A1H3EMY6_9RHOB|nr:hypothetical protein [Ruegeria halocynthiae]SDX79324.1 hypothetical protein SAMN05444358_111111 [Ruegeria halocynthiae]
MMAESGPTSRVSPARRPLWKRLLLILAAFGFAIGVYVSIRAKPELVSDLNYIPLLILVVFGIPITVALNTEEFRLSGQLIGREFSRISALEITIVASVANMLPIPGGTMVRIGALKAKGANLKEGTAATFLISFLWVGVAFLYSGVWLLVIEGEGTDRKGLGLIFCLFGLLLLIVVAAVGIHVFKKHATVVRLALVKIGLVLIDATRIFLCFRVLGVDGTFGQASVLTVSSVVGASISIVPAGLGIREGTAALLSPLVALAAAAGYLATSLNRIVGLMVLAPIAVCLGLRSKTPSEASEP